MKQDRIPSLNPLTGKINYKMSDIFLFCRAIMFGLILSTDGWDSDV